MIFYRRDTPTYIHLCTLKTNATTIWHGYYNVCDIDLSTNADIRKVHLIYTYAYAVLQVFWYIVTQVYRCLHIRLYRYEGKHIHRYLDT